MKIQRAKDYEKAYASNDLQGAYPTAPIYKPGSA